MENSVRALLDVQLSRLDLQDVAALCEAIRESSDQYNKYFTPFALTPENFSMILNSSIMDRYYVTHVGNEIAGFYMLRGLDKGFQVPSYGVWIRPRFASLGIGTLTIYHALAICRASGIRRLMLKVHPENIIALRIYEKCGFRRDGKDDKNGNLIFLKDL